MILLQVFGPPVLVWLVWEATGFLEYRTPLDPLLDRIVSKMKSW